MEGDGFSIGGDILGLGQPRLDSEILIVTN
jgi:hypothetical protein